MKRKIVLLILSFIFLISLAIETQAMDIKEFFPIKHNIFVKGPKMHYYHNYGPAVLLKDGNVLVIGGPEKKAEIYDYKKNKFISTKNDIHYNRALGATATLLNDGRVLITGGYTRYKIKNKLQYFYPDHSEIYDPKTGLFSQTANLCIPRDGHTAILMDNGNVLIIGGAQDKPYQPFVTEIEEFNPNTNTFKIIAKIPYTSGSASGIKLNNNKILIFGAGFKERISTITRGRIKEGVNTGLIYDYTTNTFENQNNPLLQNVGQHKTATLDDGRILLYTSYPNRLLLIDPDLKEIKQLSDSYIEEKNYDYTLTPINKGIILIGGSRGSHISFWIPRKTLIFDTDSLAFKPNKAGLNIPRYTHNAVKLNNGNILIIGGSKGWEEKRILQSEIYYQ